MGVIRILSIDLENPTAVYQSGQHIKGNLVLTNPKQALRKCQATIALIGKATAKWHESRSIRGDHGERHVEVYHYRGVSVFLNSKKTLGDFANKKIVIPAGGMISLPFDLLIRKDCPGSADAGFEDCSELSYYLEAKVTSEGSLAGMETCIRAVQIIPTFPLPRPRLLQRAIVEKAHEKLYMVWCICGGGCRAIPGSVSLALQLNRRCFVPGEFIDASNSYVFNETGEMQFVFMGLRMYGVLEGRNAHAIVSSKNTRKTTREFIFVNQRLPPSQKVVFSQYQLPPTIPPSFSGSYLTNKVLRWTYTIYLQVGATSSTDDTCGHVCINLPILIAAPSFQAPQVHSVMPTDATPLSDRETENPWIIFWDTEQRSSNSNNRGGPCKQRKKYSCPSL